jgi:hypothetical protein
MPNEAIAYSKPALFSGPGEILVTSGSRDVWRPLGAQITQRVLASPLLDSAR